MKFKFHGRMKSCPSIGLEAHLEPLDFKVGLRGGLHGTLGPFEAQIGEFPVRVAIPFLRRRPVLASIGPIPLEVKRIPINIDKATLDAEGVVGLNGLRADIKSKVDCSTDVEMHGRAAGRISVPHLELDDDEWSD